MTRPSVNGSTVATPAAAVLIQLLGAKTFGSIALTTDQLRHVHKLYGLVPEKPNEKPAAPVPPVRADFKTQWDFETAQRRFQQSLKAHAAWADPQVLLQAGADRSAMRHAEADGVRIIAWLAKYVPAGEDPLKHVIQLAVQAGLDVSSEDVAWAESEA